MGFMDKVKDSVKSADEKLGNAIDKEKIDGKIRDQEKIVDECTKEIGKKVVAALKDGKTAADADVQGDFDKIKAAEEEIEKLKAEKESIGAKSE